MRCVIAVVGCLGVVAGVLMPLGLSAQRAGSVLAATTQAAGTLEVTVNRSGTYTVSGQGIRQRADKSTTLQLPRQTTDIGQGPASNAGPGATLLPLGGTHSA